MPNEITIKNTDLQPLNTQFVSDVRSIIATAQQNAVRSVDFCRV